MNERKKAIDMRTEKTNFFQKRNQLEELFLSCVEETRKDIERRKGLTLARSNSTTSTLHNKSGRAGSALSKDNIAKAVTNEQFT